MAIDGGNAAGKADGVNFHSAVLAEIDAVGHYRLLQAHASMPTLANKLAVRGHFERSQREVCLAQAALGKEFACPRGVQFLKRLQGGDAQLLRMRPTENLLGLDDAFQRGNRLGRMNAAKRFGGSHAQKRSRPGGQIAIHNVHQAAKRFAVRGHADFVDDQRHRPGAPLPESWRTTRSCEMRGKFFMRPGRKTSTARGSILLSRPTISVASGTGPPRTVLRRYCTASSPKSTARLAMCSASSRKLQRLRRLASCSIVLCGSSFRTLVSPAEVCRARNASSTNSGIRSSMPIFPRNALAIPGRWVSMPATKSSACSMAEKQRWVAACWLKRTNAALTSACDSASCSTLRRTPR